MIFPRPPQTGHAPRGLLNEKRYSSGWRNVIPSSSKRLEYSSEELSLRRMSLPSPTLNAVSIEERSLVCRSSQSFCGHGEPSSEYGRHSLNMGSFRRSINRLRCSGYFPLSAILIISSMRMMPSSPKKREYPSSFRRSINSTLSSLADQFRSARIYVVLESPLNILAITSLTL